MCGSEVWVVAQPRDDISEGDWAWLATWLSEQLGVPIRIILCQAPLSVRISNWQLVIYYGNLDFLRHSRHRYYHSSPWIGMCATLPNFLSIACRWLWHNQSPNLTSYSLLPSILDRAVIRLRKKIARFLPNHPPAPYWPSPYKLAIVLTHDVDAVDRWTTAHVFHLARCVPERLAKEGLRAVMRLPWSAVRGLWDSAPLGQRLTECIAIEKKSGVRSTYLFFAPQTTYRKALDGWYTPKTRIDSQQTVATVWKDLQANGFEIGLHLSIGAHDNPKAITAEWDSLREHIPTLKTCRSHYLKQLPGVTDVALACAGALVELNLVCSGYSHGSGLPFSLGENGDSFYRLPTVIEDSELEINGSDPTIRSTVWEKWEVVLNEAKRNGTVATVLLHPENPGANEMLARLLAWGKKNEAWITSAADLIDHWLGRKRKYSLIGTLARN